jgi:tetratricopeptide (TPR) repeat protein
VRGPSAQRDGVVIDDEKLQELLSKASSLYNNGQYQGAIEAWQEALTVDPQSQKAREGIRMATLLLGDWDAAAPPSGAEEEPAAPADGAGETGPEVSPEELEASLDVGIARVKQLLAERKYQQAIEGARSLLPLGPSSEEVQRLLEEAQQAFESAPFIEEHLALSKDLLGQERYAEAEAECKKVFVLDREHPGARDLLQEIKRKIQESLKRAAGQLGGMTVKLTLPEVRAAAARPAAPEEAFVESPSEPPAPEEPTVVEAKTLVPPSTRIIPSRPPAPPPEPEPREAAPKPVEAPSPPGSIPVSETGGADETAAWETELAQLNLRAGERDLLKGTAAKATGIPVDQSAEADLLSLLDEPGGGAPMGPAPAARSAEPPATASHEVAAPRPESREPEQVAPERPRPQGRRETATRESSLRMQETPSAVTRPRGQRVRTSGAPGAKPRSSGGRVGAFLVLLLLAGGAAAYWFYFQPRILGGTGSPDQPVTPPSGSSSGMDPDPLQGPIPTPIGGTSRQQGGPQTDEAVVGVAPGAPAMGSQAIGESGDESAEGGPVVQVAPAKPSPTKPPAPPPLSREEIRRRVTLFTADGRRMMSLGKWREARDKLSAALALDPVNFEVKELLDQAQSRFDEEQRLHDDLESVKSLIVEKDFENALRKLYRLPRDRGLGDLDLYIRNAWFNWAVVLMKAGNVSDALQKLSEVLAVDPDDADALKLQQVAERYASKAKDRVYYAFTDTLKVRAYDQR